MCVCVCKCTLLSLFDLMWVCERESVCINVIHIYRYILVRQSVLRLLACCACCSLQCLLACCACCSLVPVAEHCLLQCSACCSVVPVALAVFTVLRSSSLCYVALTCAIDFAIELVLYRFEFRSWPIELKPIELKPISELQGVLCRGKRLCYIALTWLLSIDLAIEH